MPRKSTKGGSHSLNEIAVSRPQYLPQDYDARHITFLRCLQACERLQIPTAKWPKLPNGEPVLLPPGPMWVKLEPFLPPRLDLFRVAEWAGHADAAWNQYRDGVVSRFGQFAEATMTKHENKSRRTGAKRTVAPRDLSCEWAMRHLCSGESWAAIARSQRIYTLHQIKRNGNAILKEIENLIAH
jgi:hypothetical protein